jgi:putative transposase
MANELTRSSLPAATSRLSGELSSALTLFLLCSQRKRYWGQHLWVRGYWVASSGNVTDEVWAEYIKNQTPPSRTIALM